VFSPKLERELTADVCPKLLQKIVLLPIVRATPYQLLALVLEFNTDGCLGCLTEQHFAVSESRKDYSFLLLLPCNIRSQLMLVHRAGKKFFPDSH